MTLIPRLKRLLLLYGFATLLTAVAASGFSAEPDRNRQEQYLKDSLLINRSGKGRYPMTTLHDKTWADWQKRTGELPPDFELMKSEPFLPEPLVLETGGTTTPITTMDQWDQKRAWIKEQYQHWVSGTVPPPPGNTEATILEDRIDPEGARVQMIELRFGPDQKGTMTLELILPPGPGPFPVYMTQWNHRDWAQLAVRRGYIGAVYAGADVKDDSDPYRPLYPDYEFSQLMRRAWGASLVVDYLETRPEVNKDQIAITGHSRNGKQSLWATAFDDRIDAVISSSCGTGGIMPWRYSDPQYTNETLDVITSIANEWFHPRLRYFFGREDKLPVDQNLLLSLIAPRPLLMTFSHMEGHSNVWAVEQNFYSIKKVYDFYKQPDNISMFVRAGEHAVAARDVERHIDFLDNRFSRNDIPWKTSFFFDYDFDQWKTEHGDDVTTAANLEPVVLTTATLTAEDLEAKRPQILANLKWLLGDEPAGADPTEIGPTSPSRIDWMDSITGRPELKRMKQINLGPYNALGDHIAGTLYYPVNDNGSTRTSANGKVPVIIYFHQYAYAHGYAVGYQPNGGRNGTDLLFQDLLDDGYAVFAIDMFGFGTRLQEALHFYTRQPNWSKLGKMVTDARACVDAVEIFDFIDQDRTYVLGDTIGGTVGLMAAAMDDRIEGVAVVAAFSPWRTSNDRYESIRVFSHQHGFTPRLGLFAGKPETVPVDYAEIMALIAPRPLLVINPLLNRHSDPQAAAETMETVKAAYEMTGGEGKLRVETPREINRITPAMQ